MFGLALATIFYFKKHLGVLQRNAMELCVVEAEMSFWPRKVERLLCVASAFGEAAGRMY